MAKWAISAVMWSLLFVGTQSVIADFDRGLAAYDRGDYATAYREFHRMAEQGDRVAQFNLGLMNETGRGIPKNDAEAVRWYRRAAEQGHGDAQFNLSVSYSRGKGAPKNDILAYKWASFAAAPPRSASPPASGCVFCDQSKARPFKLTRHAHQRHPSESVIRGFESMKGAPVQSLGFLAFVI